MKTIKGILVTLTMLNGALLADEPGGIYSMHDRNGDGYLDRQEFQHYLKNRRIKPAYRSLWVFETVDANRDGRISNLEMVETLKKELALRKQSARP